MAIPVNREQFKSTCLRKLGAPVIQINLADDQIDDCIDEALGYFYEAHYNGTEKAYIAVKLDQSMIDAGFVTLPGQVIGVSQVMSGWNGSFSGKDLFNVEREFLIQDWKYYSGSGMTSYYLMRQSMSTFREWMTPDTMIRFNRYQGGRVYLDVSKVFLRPDQFLVFECYTALDGDEFPDIWKDRWLQNYATALIKERWGAVLSKFTGVMLVGGMTFSGDLIYQQAVDEKMKLEEELRSSYNGVVPDFFG